MRQVFPLNSMCEHNLYVFQMFIVTWRIVYALTDVWIMILGLNESPKLENRKIYLSLTIFNLVLTHTLPPPIKDIHKIPIYNLTLIWMQFTLYCMAIIILNKYLWNIVRPITNNFYIFKLPEWIRWNKLYIIKAIKNDGHMLWRYF